MPCWEYPPKITGGLGVACGGLAEELGKRVDLTVVTPDDAGEGAYEGGYSGDLKARVHAFTDKVLSLGSDFDLVHAHDWMAFPAAMELGRKGMPVIAHVHSLESDRSGEGGDPWIATVERQGIEQADRVIAVSHYTAGKIVRRCQISEERLRVVHNGSPSLVEAPVKPTQKIVSFIGRMTAQKGPDLFLEMAALLAKIDPEVRFMMAGCGDMLDSLKQEAGGLGMNDRMEFVGFLDVDEVHQLLSKTAVSFMPSRSEPFGLVALEAAAFGVPTVLTQRAGVAEVMPSNPVVPVGDANAATDVIRELLCDKAERARIGRRVHEEARLVTWQNAAEKVLAVYQT